MAVILLTTHFIFDQNYSLHRSEISHSDICKLHGFQTVYIQFVVKNAILTMHVFDQLQDHSSSQDQEAVQN